MCRDGTRLGICAAETNAFTSLPDALKGAFSGWATGGAAFYWSEFDTRSVTVYLIDVRTFAKTFVKKIEVADPAGLVRVGTPALTPDARAYTYWIARTFSRLFVVDGLQ